MIIQAWPLFATLSLGVFQMNLVSSSVAPHIPLEVRAFNTTKQISELPPTKLWPHFPLFVKSNPEACGGTLDVEGVQPHESCPIGVPFEFESEYFKGKLLFRVRDLQTTKNLKDNTNYFDKAGRHNQFIIQGRFKKEVPASDIVYGGEFKKRLKRAPPAWFEGLITTVFNRINAGIKFRLSASTPSALVNLPSSLKVLRADIPGYEPDISSFDLEENNSAFGRNGGHGIWPVDSKRRKKLFSNPDTAKGLVFDTQHVYTFEHYDDIMDYKNYEMDLGLLRYDMSKVLDSEPFQIMAKNVVNGKHLWSFQLWHEKLL